MADFDEHWGLGSTCHGKVLQQNRHGPLDRYYLAPNRYYLPPRKKQIQSRSGHLLFRRRVLDHCWYGQLRVQKSMILVFNDD